MIDLENATSEPLKFVSPYDRNAYLVGGNWFALLRWSLEGERSRTDDPKARTFLTLLIDDFTRVLESEPATKPGYTLNRVKSDV